MINKEDSKALVDFINDLSGKVKFNQHKEVLINFITQLTDTNNKTLKNATFDKADDNCFHTIRKTPHELDNSEQRKNEKKKGYKVMTQGESERGQKYSPKIEK